MTRRQERFVAGAGGKTEKEKKKKKGGEKKVLLHEQSVGKQRKKTPNKLATWAISGERSPLLRVVNR